MNTKLFVGNLSFDVTENDLQDLFVPFGPVSEVNLMTDRATGRSRGFAFVTMATPEGAQAAIQGMAGKDMKGRALTVNEARPREERSGGGGGGRRAWRLRGSSRRRPPAFPVLTDCVQAGRKPGEPAPPALGSPACPDQTPSKQEVLLSVEEPIEIEGTVATVLPGTMFRVKTGQPA